ncbi:hypothetical protein ACI0X9_003285 [Cronobacter turicensis]
MNNIQTQFSGGKMAELKYWTANLVPGDKVFCANEDGQMNLATVTVVTGSLVSVSEPELSFDRLTARNAKGYVILPDDAEQREKYACQVQRAKLSALDPEALSDDEVGFMFGALNYLRGKAIRKVSRVQKRQWFRALRIASLTDTEVYYILAGLKLANKTRARLSK